MKHIYLNENKLSLLTEISIKDKYEKESQMGKTKLSFEDFEFLCNLDPTSKPNQVGKYANWILAKYVPNTDWNQLKRCLEWYADGIKRNIIKQLGVNTDINSFKSYEDFINAINGINKNDNAQISNSEYNNRKKLEGQFNIISSTSFYDIVEPLTYQAERYFGSHTEWCTVANKEYFDDYVQDGPLYIIYPKNGDSNMKMQFHFVSNSFADKYDEVLESAKECIDNVVQDENIKTELLNLCKQIWDIRDLLPFDDLVTEFKERLANGGDFESLVGINYDIGYGCKAFTIRDYMNILTKDKQILSDQWFHHINEFRDGFAVVELNERFNFVNTEGQLLFPNKWFNYVYDFHEGFAKVELGIKWNFINTEGRIAFPNQWFTKIGDFEKGFAPVLLNATWHYLDTEGNLYDRYKNFIRNLMTESYVYKTSLIENYNNNNYKTKSILKEDKRTDQAKKRCLDVIRNHFGNASWLDTVFEHQDNPDGLTYLNYMFKQFMETFYHNPQMRSSNVMRLAPLFCKLAFEANFQNNNPDNNKLQRLNAILNHIYNMGVQGKLDVSKIGLDATYEQLNNMFGSVIDDLKHQEDERIANTTYERNSDYEIIGPIDYETAHEYGNQSCPTSKLCYTQSQTTWNNYTANGSNNVYVCLKKGWENVEPIHDGEGNSQYDTYGLSMIFVFVDETGDLTFCNTRWNHEGSLPQGFSVDHAMSKEMLSKIIGAPFNSAFKPNNKWQMISDEVMKRLSNGEDPNDIFEEVAECLNYFMAVKINEKWNFINTEGQLVSPNLWFDGSNDFIKGFAKVWIYGKGYNFINTEGQLLSPNQWFDTVGYFRNGFVKVQVYGKGWNWINTEGQYISKDWFSEVDECSDGFFTKVLLYGKGYNFLNTERQLVSPNLWFDAVYDFHEGFAKVYLRKEGYNLINTEGQLVSPNQWFHDVGNFREGFFRVNLNENGWNFINTEGQIVFPNQRFDFVDNFIEGFAKVYVDKKGYNFINTEGQFLTPNQWFDFVYNFHEGFAKVELEESLDGDEDDYYLDTEGNLYDKDMNLIRNLRTESRFYNSSLIENYNNEYNQNDVDMSSFEKQTSLQQDLWDSEDKLNSRARLRLLDIADDFIETLGISWIKPIDIILTGSLCNYNWSLYSDVDLHVIIDFAEINEKKDFVQEYFNAKKNEWNESHQDLKIFGFNVELFVEDIDNNSVRDGIYSLEKDKWIKKPFADKIQPLTDNKEEKIKYFASRILTKIEELENEFNLPYNEVSLDRLSRKIDKTLDTLKQIRQNGLNAKGEMSIGNIIYKICRRTGYLDKLWELKNKVYDKKNSL